VGKTELAINIYLSKTISYAVLTRDFYFIAVAKAVSPKKKTETLTR
jgi:hypothetical protein